MERFVREIRSAIDAKLYILALMSALTLPDLCAALESADGTTSKKKFMAWADKWIAPMYPRLSSEDLYSLRCGIAHQARTSHPNSSYSRMIFTLPSDLQFYLHNNILGDQLNLDLETFCNDVIATVNAWMNEQEKNPIVQNNMQQVLQYRHGELAPFIGGIAVDYIS